MGISRLFSSLRILSKYFYIQCPSLTKMRTEVCLELRLVLKNKSQKVLKGTLVSKQFCQSYDINTDK